LPPMVTIADWPRRLAALILDSLFLGAFLGGLWYVNASSSRSFILFLIPVLIAWLYKPFMEYYYGATLGKMILKIRVVNRQYRLFSFPTSLLRNCLFFIAPLGSIPISYLAFQDPLVMNTEGFAEFSSLLYMAYPQLGIVSGLQLLAVAVDGIFLLVNAGRGNLSLKDILAATYVIPA